MGNFPGQSRNKGTLWRGVRADTIPVAYMSGSLFPVQRCRGLMLVCQ